MPVLRFILLAPILAGSPDCGVSVQAAAVIGMPPAAFLAAHGQDPSAVVWDALIDSSIPPSALTCPHVQPKNLASSPTLTNLSQYFLEKMVQRIDPIMGAVLVRTKQADVQAGDVVVTALIPPNAWLGRDDL